VSGRSIALPSGASVGFVSGAHMANFTCLAAARHEVLRRVGWDVEEQGLQRACGCVMSRQGFTEGVSPARYPAQWWAPLVGAPRVYPHQHYATILKKENDARRATEVVTAVSLVPSDER
jgi:hypothetical protein